MQSDNGNWLYQSTSFSSNREIYLPVHTGPVSELFQLSLCADSPDGESKVIYLMFVQINHGQVFAVIFTQSWEERRRGAAYPRAPPPPDLPPECHWRF